MRTSVKEKMKTNDREEIKINIYGCKIGLSPILFLLLFHTFLSFIPQIPHQFLLHAAYMDFPIQVWKNYIGQSKKNVHYPFTHCLSVGYTALLSLTP